MAMREHPVADDIQGVAAVRVGGVPYSCFYSAQHQGGKVAVCQSGSVSSANMRPYKDYGGHIRIMAAYGLKEGSENAPNSRTPLVLVRYGAVPIDDTRPTRPGCEVVNTRNQGSTYGNTTNKRWLVKREHRRA